MTHSDITQRIVACLSSLQPEVCQVTNFSDQHSRGDNSHFSITLVSSQFIDTNRLERQRMVNRLLQPMLHNPVHAWTLSLFTPEQWQTHPHLRNIPPCRGA